MSIIISDLQRYLFPERDSCLNTYFVEYKTYLKQADITEQGMLNISFVVKMSKYSKEMKKEELRVLCYMLFNKIVDHYYDWNKPYNWQDLKLLLIYFMYFSKAKTLSEIKRSFQSKSFNAIISKYKPLQLEN